MGESDEWGQLRADWLDLRRRLHAARHGGDTATEARLRCEGDLLASRLLIGESRLLRGWAEQTLADLRRRRAGTA